MDKAIFHLILNCAKLFELRIASELRSEKIQHGQAMIIQLLANHDNLTVSEIARNIDVKGSTATVMIQSLVKLNFVERKRSEVDERVVNIKLTEKGKKIVDLVNNCWQNLEQDLLKSVPLNQRKSFKEMLLNIRDSFMQNDIN